MEQAADLGREPNVPVGQSAEGVEQHPSAAPGRSRRRNVDHQLASNRTQAPIDVGFIGHLLVEQKNPEAREGSL